MINVTTEPKRTCLNKQILTSNNKRKTTSNIIRIEKGKKDNYEDIYWFSNDEDESHDHQVISDSFNNYFLSIAEKISHIINRHNIDSNNEKTPLHYLLQLFSNPFLNIKFSNTSTQEIERITNSLQSKRSHGYDEISTRILKISAPFISSPLNYICNKSLSTGIFPTRLKYSMIKPLYKKHDKNNVDNYTPISLLTSFSKVIYARLLKHNINNNILVNEQFGFRSKS